jgi:hypothetical protein
VPRAVGKSIALGGGAQGTTGTSSRLDDASTWFSGSATGNGSPGGAVAVRERGGGCGGPTFCYRGRCLVRWFNQVQRTDSITHPPALTTSHQANQSETAFAGGPQRVARINAPSGRSRAADHSETRPGPSLGQGNRFITPETLRPWRAVQVRRDPCRRPMSQSSDAENRPGSCY